MRENYRLAIGQKSYSSWSLRAWLLLERFGLPFETQHCGLYSAEFQKALAPFAPARTVPALLTPEGDVVYESLAIAEELASRHPELPFWPSSSKARAAARVLTAEMHAGFQNLRQNCPMNLRLVWDGFVPSAAVLADLARIEELWAWARNLRLSEGPWLFGEYSIADAFYAPVAGRIAGYRLPVGSAAADYVAAHLGDPAFRRWRAAGLAAEAELTQYEQNLPRAGWPPASHRRARPVASGTPVNALCPYSGRPVTHLLEMDGRIFGFCNAACRDKTVIDPEAWPQFMALV